jgi:DNA-binding NarL/FixJ family response regulator
MHKILLIEDTKDTADSLRDQIQRSGQSELMVDPIGDAGNGLMAVLRHRPDVVALDMHLLDRPMGSIDKKHGIKLITDIRNNLAAVPILVMTQWLDPIFPLVAKHYGANGFYQKDLHRGRFCEAIDALATGRTWFLDDGPMKLDDLVTNRSKLEGALRPRQHEVFRLSIDHYVAKGRRRGVAKWIQTELATPDGKSISESQVERNLREIREALGIVMRKLPVTPSAPRIRKIYDHIQMIDDVVLPFGYDLVPPTT